MQNTTEKLLFLVIFSDFLQLIVAFANKKSRPENKARIGRKSYLFSKVQIC